LEGKLPANDTSRLDSIVKKILEFRDERDWSQFHSPKNLAEAINIEAAELLEIFLWMTTEQSRRLDKLEIQHVKNELADIFIFSTYLCHQFDIDLLDAVDEKIEQNSVKYPVSKSKGSSKKYNAL
jgi:NTP pyrophosphatase (non-canonical NTP hydrolase)